MKIFEEKGITHLDLHGEKHEFVSNVVLDFVYRFQDKIPLIIICGNSQRMIDIVSQCLVKNNINSSSPRYGIVRVEGFI